MNVTWEHLPNLPYPTSGQFAGVSGGALICAGGSNFPVSLFAGGKKVWFHRVSVLPAGARAWRQLGDLLPADGPSGYGVAAAWRDSLVTAGGAGPDRHYPSVSRLRWDGSRLTIDRLPDLPLPLAYCSGAVIGDTLYVVGGQESPTATAAHRDLFTLDLSTPGAAWQRREPLPGRGRIIAPAAALDGALIVTSGCDLSADKDGKPFRTYLTDTWRYRPGGRGWERLPDVPYPCAAAPACAYKDQFLAIGGDDGANVLRIQELKDKHPGFRRTVLAFQGRTWRRLPLAYREGMVTTPGFLYEGRPTIIGGEDRPGHRQPLVLRWKEGA